MAPRKAGKASTPGREQRSGVKRFSAKELLAGAGPTEVLGDEVAQPAKRVQKEKERVRVWWPPTRDKSRTGFSGAYWPALVVRKTSSGIYTVQYDNGEREDGVLGENIFPAQPPLDFGAEVEPVVAGEFVEVSNESKTDPCAWIGLVESVGAKVVVSYPFHDSPDEQVKPRSVRRARVWDDRSWKLIQTGQTWKPGEVTSPLELNLLEEAAYLKALKAAARAGGGSKAGGGGAGSSKAAAAAAAKGGGGGGKKAAGGSSKKAAAAAAGSSGGRRGAAKRPAPEEDEDEEEEEAPPPAKKAKAAPAAAAKKAKASKPAAAAAAKPKAQPKKAATPAKKAAKAAPPRTPAASKAAKGSAAKAAKGSAARSSGRTRTPSRRLD